MAVRNFVFFLLTALVAVNLIFAESEQPPHSDDHQAVGQEGPDRDSNGRWFWTRYRSCNYTAAPGSTCLNCYTASNCFASNLGTLRACRGFRPYCNAGRCSFIPSANCSAAG